ncbi:MAG TPA: ATP-binding protein [Syntrophomonadaceae bacterium]|nr:ATP-binding protein [Syntrophomonadaceae bacterium]
MLRSLTTNLSNIHLIMEILASVKDCIIGLDSNYKVCYWNKGAHHLFGLSELEVMGKDIFNLIEWPELFVFLHNIQAQECDDSLEVNISKDEKEVFRLIVDIICDNNQQNKHIIITLTNISELMATEVREKKANLAKTEFMANLSHEIRTPLVGILGFCELLMLQKDLGENETEYVETIEYCAHQLMGLVNNVLDLSKIEAGELEVNKRPFDLRDMVKKTIFAMRPNLKKKNLICIQEINPEIPDLLIGDELKIQQIFTNLVTNAVKYTNNGYVKIRVESDNRFSKDPGIINVKLSVYDTGSGIESDKIAEVFNPFFRINKTDKSSGAGLGLAISKKLVEEMGGQIWYEPNGEQGSVFSFSLPLELASMKISEAVKEYSFIPSRLANIKILLVEDITINRKLIALMLANMGCEVIQATNGKECLEKLQATNPDIILMDMQMPVLDGYEATRLIRTGGVWPNIPIIALTAYAMTSDIDKCIFAGCNDYLSKPFTQAQLYEVITRCLDNSHQTGTN